MKFTTATIFMKVIGSELPEGSLIFTGILTPTVDGFDLLFPKQQINEVQVYWHSFPFFCSTILQRDSIIIDGYKSGCDTNSMIQTIIYKQDSIIVRNEDTTYYFSHHFYYDFVDFTDKNRPISYQVFDTIPDSQLPRTSFYFSYSKGIFCYIKHIESEYPVYCPYLGPNATLLYID